MLSLYLSRLVAVQKYTLKHINVSFRVLKHALMLQMKLMNSWSTG